MTKKYAFTILLCIVWVIFTSCGKDGESAAQADTEKQKEEGTGISKKEQEKETVPPPEPEPEPEKEQPAENESGIQKIVVSIDSNGKTCIGDALFSKEKLIEIAEKGEEEKTGVQTSDEKQEDSPAIRPVRVIIQADKEASFRQVQDIIRICAQNGISRISFGTHKVDLPADTGVMIMPGLSETRKIVPFNILFTVKDGKVRFQEKAQGVRNFDEFEKMLKQCNKEKKEAEVTVTCQEGVPYKYVFFAVDKAKQYGVSRIRFGYYGSL